MIIGCPSCVVRRASSTIASKDISSKTTGWNLTKLCMNDPYMALFINCSNSISRSHRLKIDLHDAKIKKKTFFSEITRPRALISGMQHHLVDLYQVSSNYLPVAKNGHAPGVTCLTPAYIGTHEKSSSLKP